MIKWIDKKSILRSSNKNFRAGEIIPAGILTIKRVEEFIRLGKVEVVKSEVSITEDAIENGIGAAKEITETRKQRQKRLRKEREENKKLDLENSENMDIENPVIENIDLDLEKVEEV